MPCPRCKGRTRAGGQCQRATCKFAPKCFQHTAVEVRPSPIGGRGLFAKRRITSGEVVADYTMAERISAAQYQALGRANQATHVAQIKGVHYDARDVRRTVAGMANTARNVQGARNNLKQLRMVNLKQRQTSQQGVNSYWATDLATIYNDKTTMASNRPSPQTSNGHRVRTR